MSLDVEMRGHLEKIIDSVILTISGGVELARAVTKAKEFQIENSDDFTVGLAWGEIITEFSGLYVTKYGRRPSEEEISQASDIVIKRTKEIKEAIFKCG